MYRHTILLFIAAAAGAPQDNSITYIKMLPQSGEAPDGPYSSPIENIPLTIGSRPDNTEDTIPTTDSTEDSALEYSSESTETTTEKFEIKTTPEVKKPKFYSKLSYFEKPNFDSVLTNLVERSGKRKFRSKCRCEKISNCPKLQITVPRCPDEYFMCCF